MSKTAAVRAQWLGVIAISAALIIPVKADAENMALVDLGNVIHHTMPAAVMAYTAYQSGPVALKESALSYLATHRTVLILKGNIRKERPNGTDDRSFPSGHAASTFNAAANIHASYGLKAATLPYALATITAVSRVNGEHHYTEDVIAGAALGMAWSFLIVNPKVSIDWKPERNLVGVSYTTSFK